MKAATCALSPDIAVTRSPAAQKNGTVLKPAAAWILMGLSHNIGYIPEEQQTVVESSG